MDRTLTCHMVILEQVFKYYRDHIDAVAEHEVTSVLLWSAIALITC